ncbi:MAG: hypothetical protein ABSB99_02985 [Acidimicrobiales bacterium]
MAGWLRHRRGPRSVRDRVPLFALPPLSPGNVEPVVVPVVVPVVGLEPTT